MQPSLPEVTEEDWRAMPRRDRIRLMSVEWVDRGFDSPPAIHIVYLLKIVLYAVVGLWIISFTPGLGGLGNLGDWWAEPVVWQKVAVFSLLFEVIGMGCGWGPLTMRFWPPMGAPFFWLRPDTIRLPPWPDRVPGTAGTRRTLFDVALYAGVLVACGLVLASPAGASAEGLNAAVGLVEPWRVWVLVAVMAVLGLRDKTIFLAARSEVYLLAAFCAVLPAADFMVASKFTLLLIWWGAAVSKMNHHFPLVVAVMEQNHPIWRSPKVSRRFVRSYPEDLRPSGLAAFLAHFGTAVEFAFPFILFVSGGGWPTTVAVIVMVLFHLHIISAIPMGAPLEWNVWMIFGVLSLFWQHAEVGLTDATYWPLLLAGFLVGLGVLAWGNMDPDRVSFLISMRYYAGNWGSSVWCFTDSAMDKVEANVTAFTGFPSRVLAGIYDPHVANMMLHRGYAFRSMHTHGRLLFALADRATDSNGHDLRYTLFDGETVAGPAIGWNFGDAHLHHEQLLAALHERCRFEPGEVRVIYVESQPIHRQTQSYRIMDPVDGVLERGHADVRDLIDAQPWDDTVAVTVETTRIGH